MNEMIAWLYSVCKAVTDGLSDYPKKRMLEEKICNSAVLVTFSSCFSTPKL